jgi:predicted  nucleic acid-binding Zn-ribbon protein
VDEFKLQIRQAELEVAELRRQAKVHLGHLNEISDSREYRALNEEIRYIERQIADKEEATLAVMEEAEKAEKVREETHQVLKDKRSEIAGQRAEIAEMVKQQTEKMRQREVAREAFYGQVPSSVKTFYDRRGKRQSMPVVWLWDDNACGYCHHRLTPQQRLEVLRSQTLVNCESCGRVIVAMPIVGAADHLTSDGAGTSS